MIRPTAGLAMLVLAAGCAGTRTTPTVPSPTPPPLNQPEIATAKSGATTKVDPTKMTCEEFVALIQDAQPRVVAWADGYAKAGTTKVEEVGAVAVQRDVGVLVVACMKTPKASLWDKIKSDLPGGGKASVKPTKITCEEFSDLDEDIQPEVVYWLDGYSKGRLKTQEAIEVDTERDVLVIVDVCKPAPKETLWDRARKHL